MCYAVGLSSLSKVKKFLLFFLSQQGEGGCVFAVFFAPIPEKGISDSIAHGSIIQVLTVVHLHEVAILNHIHIRVAPPPSAFPLTLIP